MNPRYERVAERAGHRCEYCRAPEVVFNFPFEVEHIIPPRRGGTEADENLALACRACNVRKAAHIEHVDPRTGDGVRLFRPREDRWDEHFRVDADAARVEGLTPTGRATVALLRMNSVDQVEARRLWMRLGAFP